MIRDRSQLPAFNAPETDSLDWKKQTRASTQAERLELAKDIAAMANARGGSIIVGVKEKSAVVDAALCPMTIAEVRALARNYEEAARDLISPPPTVETVPIELDQQGASQWILAVNINPTEAIFCAVRRRDATPGQNNEDSWWVPQRVASNTKYLNPAEAQALTVEKLRSATNQTLSLIESWQARLRSEERVRRFEEFLERESHHDICFPTLGADEGYLGLQYTIRPVRTQDGRPLPDKGEMRSRWLVHVDGPAHESVLSEQDLARYDASPIRDGENYYCEFYNDSWHLTDGNSPPAFPFFLSGKVGHVEVSESANAFVARSVGTTVNGLTTLFELVLDANGRRIVSEGSGSLFSVRRDSTSALFLCINGSPPKSVYLTNPTNSYDDSGWYLEIENLRGHGNKEVRAAIASTILDELQARQVVVPKVPWHQTYRASR